MAEVEDIKTNGSEDNGNEMTSVAISQKAAKLARDEKDRRFTEMGIKMTVGAVVSEAVFKAYGKDA